MCPYVMIIVFISLCFNGVFSANVTSKECDPCIYGRPLVVNGTCQCDCFLGYSGEFCTDSQCNKTGCSSPTGGFVIGDCQCQCRYSRYRGPNCDIEYCPFQENKRCNATGGFPPEQCMTDSSGTAKLQCPYMCGVCKRGRDNPTCEEDPECHESALGCIYRGKRPSIEMCRTLGKNGSDIEDQCFGGSQEENCRLCSASNEFNKHSYLTKCPVMCGVCPEQQSIQIDDFVLQTTAPGTSTTPTYKGGDFPIDVIIGIAIGSVAFIALVICLFILCIRCKRNSKTETVIETKPSIIAKKDILVINENYTEVADSTITPPNISPITDIEHDYKYTDLYDMVEIEKIENDKMTLSTLDTKNNLNNRLSMTSKSSDQLDSNGGEIYTLNRRPSRRDSYEVVDDFGLSGYISSDDSTKKDRIHNVYITKNNPAYSKVRKSTNLRNLAYSDVYSRTLAPKRRESMTGRDNDVHSRTLGHKRFVLPSRDSEVRRENNDTSMRSSTLARNRGFKDDLTNIIYTKTATYLKPKVSNHDSAYNGNNDYMNGQNRDGYGSLEDVTDPYNHI